MDWTSLGQVGLQWFGSLVIAVLTAALTVRLSLRRFHAEKLWEKRLNAYMDVTAGLSEMLRTVGKWLDEYMEHREFTEKYDAELRERYNAARRKFEEIHGIASLLLPTEVSQALSETERALSKRKESYFESLDENYVALRRALDTVTTIGRRDLYGRKTFA